MKAIQPKAAPWSNERFPSGISKLTYRSPVDGLEDWALLWPGTRAGAWLVFLHGHGSQGDQLFTRADIRDACVRFSIERHASRTACASPRLSCTPPTSVLWVMVLEWSLTTTG